MSAQAGGRTGSPPRIDVVCPTYNRSSAIRPTIESVLAQTVEDWRLLVVSDGSTDDTDEVVRGYDDPRISLIHCERHGHPGGPRNIGLAAAEAPYIAYLDHDDRWRPNHLAVLLDRFDQGARLVVTGSIGVDGAGAEVYRSDLFNSVWHPDLQLLRAMYEPSRVGHVRGLVDDAGGWTTEHAGLEDWDLWLRLADRGERFTVVTERTAVLHIAPSTRRHSMRVRHRMVLGTVPDEAAARSVKEAILSAEYQARLRPIFTEDVLAWYREMASSGRLVLPDDVSPARLLDYIEHQILGSDKLVMFGDLGYHEENGRFVIACPLECSSDAHADRIMRFREARDRLRNDIVREVIARHQSGTAGAGTGPLRA
jgi:glycosyltransferase involved in cell wall biosynthesis